MNVFVEKPRLHRLVNYLVKHTNTPISYDVAPRLEDVTCTNGQKFVLNKAKGVRKQFLVIDGKVFLAFITKGKKFTACSSFLDITSKVNFIMHCNGLKIPVESYFSSFFQVSGSCKTLPDLATVDLSVTPAPTTTTTMA